MDVHGVSSQGAGCGTHQRQGNGTSLLNSEPQRHRWGSLTGHRPHLCSLCQLCPRVRRTGRLWRAIPAPALCAQQIYHISQRHSLLPRPHLEHCIQLQGPQRKKDMDLLEQVQRRIPGLEQLSCAETLRELRVFSLERRRLQGHLTAAFRYVKGAHEKGTARLFTRVCSDRRRGEGFKRKEGRFKLDMRNKRFTLRVVTRWHVLPREAVDWECSKSGWRGL